jgi:16S rRNA (guanine527-N7)-methyltransferase
MKGANWEAELADAKNAIETLGGALEETRTFEIRNGDRSEQRCLLVIRKVRPCPMKYPRAWGKIKSKPI